MVKSLHTAESDLLRDLLLSAREKSNLTQAEVAIKLGRPQSFVSKYESGERRLDVVEFIHVCNALGLDPMRVLADFLSKFGTQSIKSSKFR